MNLYELDPSAGGNGGVAGFPEQMLFRDVNDRFREYMAAKAAFLADTAGRNEISPRPGVTTDYAATSVVGDAGLFQTFTSGLPDGTLLTARISGSTTSPPYLIAGDAAARTIVGPKGGALPPGSLEENSLYTFVLRGSVWQVVSEPVGSPSEPARAVLVNTTLPLSAADVGGLVVVISTELEITATIDTDMLSRWPVGGAVSIAAVAVQVSTLTAPPAVTVEGAVALPSPGEWTLYGGAGTVFFQLIRTGVDEILFVPV